MMTHRNSDNSVTIPLDNTSGEVAQFGLRISHADTQGTRGKETLPQPPEAGLLTHTGRAGGRFDTTPLSHSGQKPNPSSRIGSQIHRRTTFKEGVATTDRIRGPLSGTVIVVGHAHEPRSDSSAGGKECSCGPNRFGSRRGKPHEFRRCCVAARAGRWFKQVSGDRTDHRGHVR